MKTAIRGVVKWCYLLFALLLILLAMSVQLGRSFSHLVADYKEPIADYLSESLNARVTFAQVQANWDGLRPSLMVADLQIANHAGESLIALDNASVRFDILRSLMARRLVWNSILLHDVQLDFIQQANGKWRLSGVPERATPAPTTAANSANDDSASSAEAVNVDQLLDMLLLSNRIEFVSSRLGFSFDDDTRVVLNAPRLLLENTKSFHRLKLDVDLEGDRNSIQLVLEGQGDPRDRKNFHSRGYLEVNALPTQAALEATSDFLFNGLSNRVLDGEGSLNAKLWLETTAGGAGFDLVGELGLQQLKLAMGATALQLDDVTTQLRGQWLFNESWWLDLIGLQSRFGEAQLTPTHLNVAYQKPQSALSVRIDSVDLAKTYGLVQASGVLGQGKLAQVLAALDPRGQLQSVKLQVPLTAPQSWRLTSQLHQVAVDHWQGVPKLDAVDGTLDTGALSGFVNLDAGADFAMHFIPTYAAPMRFDRARGQVAWHLRPDEGRVYINSGALQFTRGSSELIGHMLVDVPLRSSAEAAPRADLTLQISARDLPVRDYAIYVPEVIPESLEQWLATALGSDNPGVASRVGLIYRGNLASRDPLTRSLNLFIDVDNATLAYHRGWPSLRAIAGEIYIRDGDVDATISGAQLRDSYLSSGQLAVRQADPGAGAILQVQAQIAGGAEDLLATLREGQLRNFVGGNMDSWLLQGAAVTRLAAEVPLANAAARPRYSVTTALSDAQLALGNLALKVDNLSGTLNFTDTQGFVDTALYGSLFDQPIAANLTTQMGAVPVSKIALQGAADVETLASWSRRPELKFLEGVLGFDARIDIHHRPAQRDKALLASAKLPQSVAHFSESALAKVALHSDLVGVKVNLPGVLSKAAAEAADFDFTYWLQESAAQVDINYADKLFAQAHVDRDPGQLLNASIGLLEPAELSATPEFLVTGQLPKFDLELWRATLNRYQEYQAALAPATGDAGDVQFDPVRKVAGLPFRAKVTLAQHKLGPVLLTDLELEAAPIAYGWKVAINNPLVAGSLVLPDSNYLPMQIHLDYLRLEESYFARQDSAAAAADSDAEPLAVLTNQVAARDLPAARVAIEQVYLGDNNYGRWSFVLNPQPEGVVIDAIEGTLRGLTVGGVPDAQTQQPSGGARLIWSEQNGQAHSQFIGSISATNMAEVSRLWQVPELIESESALFVADLNWPGVPGDIAINSLSGALSVGLTRGRFYRNASAGDGVLRLLSVVNFDSIARRLRLDFSDLYQSGLAYDSITGDMSLQAGLLHFKTPLDLRGPSSRLQLAGSVDLKREELNSRLIATLPVAGNLTFAAALVTGLPAAAGVYLVSKLFKKQVDRATSITYTISGAWDNPVVRFRRFFESEENLAQNALQASQIKTETETEIEDRAQTQADEPQRDTQTDPDGSVQVENKRSESPPATTTH